MEIKDLIRDKIVPLCKNLRTNPQSNQVLLNNNDATLIISVLNKTKIIFKNQSSIDKIDELISRVNLSKNKTNGYISNSLSS